MILSVLSGQCNNNYEERVFFIYENWIISASSNSIQESLSTQNNNNQQRLCLLVFAWCVLDCWLNTKKKRQRRTGAKRRNKKRIANKPLNILIKNKPHNNTTMEDIDEIWLCDSVNKQASYLHSSSLTSLLETISNNDAYWISWAYVL